MVYVCSYPFQCTLYWNGRSSLANQELFTKSLIFISIKCFSPTPSSLNLPFNFSFCSVLKWMTHDHSSDILNIATTGCISLLLSVWVCVCMCYRSILQRCNIYWIGKASTLIDSQKNQRLCDTQWAHIAARCQFGGVSPTQPTFLLLLFGFFHYSLRLDCTMHFNVVCRMLVLLCLLWETEWGERTKHVAQLSNCYRTCKFRWRDGFIEFDGF